jgi:trigger factor
MNIIRENIDELNAVLRVKLSPSDYQPQIEKTLKDYQKKVQMHGFRPGKVPKDLLKKMYGKSIKVEEVNRLLSNHLSQYLTENKIDILGNPLPKYENEQHIDWDQPLEYEFLYELGLAPVFDANLTAYEFTYYKIVADQESTENTLNRLRRSYGKMLNPEFSETGDVILGRFQELDENGNIKEGGINHSSSVAIDFIKDEEQKKKFIGLKKEDNLQINPLEVFNNATDRSAMLGITSEQAENLNANFLFTVENINRIELADLNQELFDKYLGEGVVSSEEEFKTKLKEVAEQGLSAHSDRKFFDEAHEKLLNDIQFSLPEEFLKKWLMAISEKPKSREEVETEFEKSKKALRWQLIESKVLQNYNVIVTEDEVAHQAKQDVKFYWERYYGASGLSDEQLNALSKNILENKEETKRIYDRLYDVKLLNLFKSKFKLIEIEVSYKEFTNLKA